MRARMSWDPDCGAWSRNCSQEGRELPAGRGSGALATLGAAGGAAGRPAAARALVSAAVRTVMAVGKVMALSRSRERSSWYHSWALMGQGAGRVTGGLPGPGAGSVTVWGWGQRRGCPVCWAAQVDSQWSSGTRRMTGLTCLINARVSSSALKPMDLTGASPKGVQCCAAARTTSWRWPRWRLQPSPAVTPYRPCRRARIRRGAPRGSSAPPATAGESGSTTRA